MLLSILNIILFAATAAVLLPIAVLCVECLAAVAIGRLQPTVAISGPRPNATVLIPAHNESAGIAATLDALLPTLSGEDQVLVVADNCDDGTAGIARARGALVVERIDADRRGKGFALDCGLRELKRGTGDPRAVVVVLDADCRVEPATIDTLVRAVTATGRPVQSLVVPDAKETRPGVGAVATLGYRLKNLVRALGMQRLGLASPLMGTGMAFPWETIQTTSLASAHLVEDKQLGVDLAIRGRGPEFVPQARVHVTLAHSPAGFREQRRRWEHGHLALALIQAPRLIAEAVRQLRPDLAGLALDLCVPPLALLLLVWTVTFSAALIAMGLGASPVPAILLAAGGSAILLSVAAAWAKFLRDDIPGTIFFHVPRYIACKIPIYTSFFLRSRQRDWVRSERDDVASPPVDQRPAARTFSGGKA